jgi:ABC-2 type transport system permease protein
MSDLAYISTFEGSRVSLWRMIKSEWIKFWSLRSTWLLIILTIVMMAGFALMIAALMPTAFNDPQAQAAMEQAAGDQGLESLRMSGVDVVTLGLQFAQLTVAVLGVLIITNEYSSGMIRATFAAAPRRGRVLLAKLITLLGTTAMLAIAGLLLSWLVTLPLLDNDGMLQPLNWSDRTEMRAMLGAVLYLMAIAALALAIGALVRATAGGIFIAVAVLMVLPMISQIVAQASGAAWAIEINKFMPTNAGGRILSTTADVSGQISPWIGFAVLVGYVVIAYLAAMFSMRSRDA